MFFSFLPFILYGSQKPKYTGLNIPVAQKNNAIYAKSLVNKRDEKVISELEMQRMIHATIGIMKHDQEVLNKKNDQIICLDAVMQQHKKFPKSNQDIMATWYNNPNTLNLLVALNCAEIDDLQRRIGNLRRVSTSSEDMSARRANQLEARYNLLWQDLSSTNSNMLITEQKQQLKKLVQERNEVGEFLRKARKIYSDLVDASYGDEQAARTERWAQLTKKLLAQKEDRRFQLDFTAHQALQSKINQELSAFAVKLAQKQADDEKAQHKKAKKEKLAQRKKADRVIKEQAIIEHSEQVLMSHEDYQQNHEISQSAQNKKAAVLAKPLPKQTNIVVQKLRTPAKNNSSKKSLSPQEKLIEQARIAAEDLAAIEQAIEQNQKHSEKIQAEKARKLEQAIQQVEVAALLPDQEASIEKKSMTYKEFCDEMETKKANQALYLKNDTQMLISEKQQASIKFSQKNKNDIDNDIDNKIQGLLGCYSNLVGDELIPDSKIAFLNTIVQEIITLNKSLELDNKRMSWYVLLDKELNNKIHGRFVLLKAKHDPSNHSSTELGKLEERYEREKEKLKVMEQSLKDAIKARNKALADKIVLEIKQQRDEELAGLDRSIQQLKIMQNRQKEQLSIMENLQGIGGILNTEVLVDTTIDVALLQNGKIVTGSLASKNNELDELIKYCIAQPQSDLSITLENQVLSWIKNNLTEIELSTDDCSTLPSEIYEKIMSLSYRRKAGMIDMYNLQYDLHKACTRYIRYNNRNYSQEQINDVCKLQLILVEYFAKLMYK